jgi:hypothetical protein
MTIKANTLPNKEKWTRSVLCLSQAPPRSGRGPWSSLAAYAARCAVVITMVHAMKKTDRSQPRRQELDDRPLSVHPRLLATTLEQMRVLLDTETTLSSKHCPGEVPSL